MGNDTPELLHDSRSSVLPRFHIVRERDVGLFALILSVIPHVQWALAEGRIPVVYFGQGCAYWTPRGYRGRQTVWEYYFEPLVAECPVASLPPVAQACVAASAPIHDADVSDRVFISASAGAHVLFDGENVKSYADPSPRLRAAVHRLVRDYIRPRDHIRDEVERFYQQHLAGPFVIGVHIRGTDALVDPNRYAFQSSRVPFGNYFSLVERLLRKHPDARIFVASDDAGSVGAMRSRFGDRVVSYDSIRHDGGAPAGTGPMGRIMPAYLTRNPDVAAKSGEEAVIEYLLLCRCHHLIHNGSGIPRMVLLTEPTLPCDNAMPAVVRWRRTLSAWRESAVAPCRRGLARWRQRARSVAGVARG